jgi:hypothetical protein
MLTIVMGPPCAGKTTWVHEHAKVGDIVIDYDALAVALTAPGGHTHDHTPHVAAVTIAARKAATETALRLATTVDVYLIHSKPSRAQRAEYHKLSAKMVTLDPGRDVVRQRAKAERTARTYTVIDEWYQAQRDDGAVASATGPAARRGTTRTAAAGAPVHAFTPSQSRAW